MIFCNGQILEFSMVTSSLIIDELF